MAIGRDLPGRLERQFGPAAIAGKPFTVAGLFTGGRRRRPGAPGPIPGSLQSSISIRAIGRNAGAVRDRDPRGRLGQRRPRARSRSSTTGSRAADTAVADISYRLAPGAVWPAQRDDVAAAVAFVKGTPPPWGVDASRLVILGRSAGGQIAEAYAYGLHDPAVRGVIALYSPADMHFAWAWGREDDPLDSPRLLRQFLGGTPDTARAAYDSASGILLAGAGSPPTLLVHGTIDTLVWNRQSERLSARLTEVKVPNLLVALPWATHALEYNLSSPSGQLTTYAVGWFLAAVCR
jgi:acetyl esterase/lipase